MYIMSPLKDHNSEVLRASNATCYVDLIKSTYIGQIIGQKPFLSATTQNIYFSVFKLCS